MSQPGPIVLVSSGESGTLSALLAQAQLPARATRWSEAARTIRRLEPSAVIATEHPSSMALSTLAVQVAALQPYVPLLVLDPQEPLPPNVIAAAAPAADDAAALIARLRAALRVRTLHATVLRRLAADDDRLPPRPDADPLDDATALLVGRGGNYPTLSVALGQRIGVVGALSIEAAARHLNLRDLNGVVLGDGFTPRVIEAFLTVLAENPRFRNLPVVVNGAFAPRPDLPNLDIVTGGADDIARRAFPLIRQHAFEIRLSRLLRSADAGGLLDPQTGLLSPAAFERDFATALYQTQARGGVLSVARFTFEGHYERASLDAARTLTRLMRRMDFGVLQDDGSLVVVFAEASLRDTQNIVKRLSGVLKYTVYNGNRNARIDPRVSVATLLPTDSVQSILGRLRNDARRAAS